MQKLSTLICAFCLSLTVSAQEQTTKLTLFNNFQPAIVHLTTGKDMTLPFANIGLKDANLLYLHGTYTMQANMDNVAGMDIEGRSYVKIEKRLSECLDTVKNNQLFCTTIIDMPAFEQNQKNSKNITNLDFSNDMTSYSTIDLESEDDRQLPVIHIFHYRYKGEIIKVHEREIWRRLPKDKRHIYKSIISLPTFSWVDRASLVQLLKAITD